MPTLESIYNQSQADIDKFVSQFDGEIEKVFDRVRRIAQAKLAGLNTDDVLQYEFIWRQSLKEAGYYQLVNELIDTQFDSIYAGTLQAFEAGGLKTAFTTDDATKIQILKQMKRDFFIRLGDDVGLTVKRELYKYVISDASVDTMATGIAQTLEGSNLAKYSQTYARTAIGEFQQEVIDLRSAEIEEGVWIYVGVNDGRTRDFCRNVLKRNKYYDDSDKSRIENDQDRAYNCRHRFYKISEERAEERGYKSN
jgi:hypothetical protein